MISWALWLGAAVAPLQDGDGLELFEKKIRPVLVERCYTCHSAQAEKLKGNLLLDTREGLLKGGDRGPAIVPRDPDRSLLVQAIRHADDDLKMPPKRKLSPEQIADFEAWIRAGAADPRAGKSTALPPVDLQKARAEHWAFRPPKNAVPPSIRHPHSAIRSDIDRFILAGLEAKGLGPSPEADPRTLLRRVTYDLIGLPPTPEETDAFLAVPSPQAYEQVVDRLLASPHYGERWGRYWLDLARYADTKGYVYTDREEPRFFHAHVYRDWVVRAFNEDMPYDRFLTLQIAADRVTRDQRDLAAMGFLTVGRRFLGVVHDIIDDRIDVVGRATLGLTLSCGRCHDHKFDPVPTADYYSLYGVFRGSFEKTVALEESAAKTEAAAAYEKELRQREEALRKAFEKKAAEVLERLRAKVKDYLVHVLQVEKLPTEEFFLDLGPDDIYPFFVRQWHAYLLECAKGDDAIFSAWHVLAAIPERDLPVRAAAALAGVRLNPRVAEAFAAAPASMREVAERYGTLLAGVHKRWKEAEKQGAAALPDAADEALRQVLYGPSSPVALPTGSLNEILEDCFDEKTRVDLGKLQKRIDEWIVSAPGATPHAVVLEERPVPYAPRVFRRGNPATKGEEVPRQFLWVVDGDGRQPFKEGSGRLELARAIASAENPLTARVLVNRLWLHHFGQGLVRTPSDFGLRSEPPTHPELLDWLALRFVEDDWSVKKLHRRILLSATYRQASWDKEDARKIDPDNRLLWRMNRRRLDFESFRDTLLSVSGRLDLALGGRPVRIETAPFSRRRTLYGFIDRLNLPGLFRLFDFAGPDAHSPQRFVTTVPQQALFLMNSPFVLEQSRFVAARPEVARAESPDAKVRALYRVVFGRAPDDAELDLGRRALESPILNLVAVRPSAWQYGFVELEAAGGKIAPFRPLPHFSGSAWQGGPDLPDPALGSLRLTALGGHAEVKHSAVRRWLAPRDGTVSIGGTLIHKKKSGDGVRGRVISSRSGELASWNVRQIESETHLRGLAVKKGETIDFLVDGRGDATEDEFAWAPVVQMTSEPKTEWDAAKEFAGPPVVPLTPLEKFVQALLMTNEFRFVD